ncbi:ATP-binding protein [Streptomyces sp. QTS137]
MRRQAQGGRPGVAGTGSVTTVDGTADEDAEQVPAAARLQRRLGRADLRAVPGSRHDLRHMLRHWGRPGQSETAELLTTELVTNALIHTDRAAVLTATVGPRGLRVEVRDFVDHEPRPRVPAADDGTHGRGLVLVESLADAWGIRAHGVGKAVWFELEADVA